jgi:hypothetical protein
MEEEGMKRFEYLRLYMGNEMSGSSGDAKLATLGNEGWEAVAGYGNSCLLFKREKSDTREQSRESNRHEQHDEYSCSR